MSEIQVVIYDFGIMSILMLIAFFVRKRVKKFQDYFIPTALIAGALGLLSGPQVLGKISPVYMPVTASVSKWSSTLVIIIFTCSFLGQKRKKFGEIAISSSIHAGINHQIQVIFGLLCAAFFIKFYDFPIAFGLTPVYGFYNGHGTALAAGTILQDFGWESAIDICNTMATAGLVGGVIIGMIIINIATRKGHTLYVNKAADISREVKIGYIKPNDRKPIGFGVTMPDCIDPLTFAFTWIGIVAAASYYCTKIFSGTVFLEKIPWFAWALILSFITGQVFNKTGLDRYIDRPTFQRISGLALDFLICSAIATMNLSAVALYIVPLIITITVIFIVTIFSCMWFGKKLYKVDAFERSIGAFGQSCGVLATGLLLIRCCDPNGESVAAESIASGTTIGYLWAIPYYTIVPILSYTWGVGKLMVLSTALLIVFLAAGRLLCWQKIPAWETAKEGSKNGKGCIGAFEECKNPQNV